ncbi:hypothetical protein CDV55_101421 [Aspergillus turcosus]|nr:hypothetical protein CDV55_101421 [Aspergillus turcosus]
MALTTLTLDGLPRNILADVVNLLVFRDLCSLCLVSRTFAATCRQNTFFQKHFETKTLEWTSTEQMQEFVHLTHENRMGCLLRHLTIVGVVGAPPAAGLQSLATLLTQAFTNLRLNPAHAGLQSTALLVQAHVDNGNGELVSVEKIRDWRKVWQTAAQTFQIISRALADSALPIEKLDVFGSVARCSLACDQIGRVLDTMDESHALEKLKSLSLSLSHHTVEEDSGGRLPAAGRRHANDIARLLQLCQQLQKLELHWYNLHTIKLDEAEMEERQFFTHVVQLAPFTQLRHCRLDGIYTDEITLLTFLQKASQLSHFSMEEIHLQSGKFGPIFDYLTSHAQHLNELHLNNLWESRLICFDEPGKPHFPTTAASDGPNILTRTGVGCRREIRYRFFKACCDIWGQCGITSEFCTPSAAASGAPGTAAAGSNGCISNCGTEIVASAPPASFAHMGYFESFNNERPCLHMTPSDIPSSYTHVLFAFANVTSSYDVSIDGAADMFQEFLETEGFDRILSFGGWTFSTDPATYPIFRQGVAAENRSTFAGNVANFIQSYNLQGVNFDWEYPGPSIIPGIPSGSPEDGANYLEFLKVVRGLLPSQYSISITAPASFYYLQNFPIYEMSQVVDFIVYMTYDLHGQWDYGNEWTDPGCPDGNCLRSQINMTETQQAFSMITKAGVPANMIMVGQPLYGRSFQMTEAGCYTEMCTYTGPNSGAFPGPCTNTAGYLSNWEINQIISNSQWSGTADQYYSEVAGDILVYDSTQWVSWMKPSTYDSRSSWAQGLNFGGVCDWAMDLNASYAANGSQIGEGSGVVYISPEIYSSASPTVTCLPPCTFVFPPWTLTTTTTITPPATTITVEDIWPSVSTETNGVTSTYYVSSTTVTTITPPPIITATVSVWNVEWTDTSDSIIYLTSSIVPPPFTLTQPPLTESSTTLPGTTYTFAPGPYPPVTTTTGPPPGPPPGYTVSSIAVVSGPPSAPCTAGCGGLCQSGCDVTIPCIGICGCIGFGCAGGGGCIGPGCDAIDDGGSGADEGDGEASTTTCATSSTVTDCVVACSITNYGDSSYVSNCYTTACSTVIACQTAGTTTTTETTTALCPLTAASYPTWTPVSGAPMPYLGTDNAWTTPGVSTSTASSGDGSGSGGGTSTASSGGGSGSGGGSPTTTSVASPLPTREALIMLSEMVIIEEFGSTWEWDWWVIDGVTTSDTDVCNVSADITVPADTASGQGMTYPGTNIGPFTSHGISGCMYYGTTDGATVGTMTCPGVQSVTCERDPQFNTSFNCGEGAYMTANVVCIF